MPCSKGSDGRTRCSMSGLRYRASAARAYVQSRRSGSTKETINVPASVRCRRRTVSRNRRSRHGRRCPDSAAHEVSLVLGEPSSTDLMKGAIRGEDSLTGRAVWVRGIIAIMLAEVGA